MGTGYQEQRHAELVKVWSQRVRECVASGQSVRSWCEGNGFAIKQYYYWKKQIQEEDCAVDQTLAGVLKRIDPALLKNEEAVRENEEAVRENEEAVRSVRGVTVLHGDSSIIFPAGSSCGTIAELVKALNRHV